MRLSGAQEEQLSEALRDAFTPATLTRMLRFKLEKNLYNLAQGEDFEQTVFLLIGRLTERSGSTNYWTARFNPIPETPVCGPLQSNSGLFRLVARGDSSTVLRALKLSSAL